MKKRISCRIGDANLTLGLPGMCLAGLGGRDGPWLTDTTADSSLWKLDAADAQGRRVTLLASAARRVSHDFTEGALSIRWEDVRDAASGAGPFDVEVSIRPLKESPTLPAWRIRVTNHSASLTLWRVEFPRLAGLRASAQPARDRFFYPDCWGMQYAGPAMPTLHRRYPRGWETTMQFFGYTRKERTLYVGAHDPRLTTKDFLFTPPRGADGRATSGRISIVHYPEDMSRRGNSFAMDYDIVAGELDGDWYDAARVYARWAREQAWARTPPAAARGPSRVSREIHAWQLLQVLDKPLAEWGRLMERLAQRLGVRIGAHIYNWHQIPFDISYPDYFPARDGVRELAARLRAAGIVAMPYINARLWDINAPSWQARNAVRFAAKLSSERADPSTLFPYLEEYGSGQKLAPMCPATPFWRDTVIDLCRRITGELGCSGVYLDQIAAEKSELCFDPAHGHPLGGGSYWPDGYRTMAAGIRDAIGAEPILTTECNWEGCIADYDALLSWHRFSDELVPMFPAVYAGLARMFGCQFSAGDIADANGLPFARRMAMLFVWGGQLGWGDLTPLLEPKHKALCDYFARLCRLRADHTELFACGRMLRPPRVEPRPKGAAGSALYASLWQAADGDGTWLLLVNPTRKPLRAALHIHAGELPSMKPAERNRELTLSRRGRRGSTYDIALPPLATRAVALCPA